MNDRKSSSSSSGSPKHEKPPKKQNPISPARRRAQRRANNSSPRRKAENKNSSPRRKGENEKTLSETIEDDSKSSNIEKTKTNSNSEGAIDSVPIDGAKDEKEDTAAQKPKTEKKNIAYTFPAHEETFIMDDKDLEYIRSKDIPKEKSSKTEEIDSKPSHNQKKLIKSPRRAKPVKVC